MLNIISISKNKNRSYNLFNQDIKKEYRNLRIGELKKLLEIYYQDPNIKDAKNYREVKAWIKNKNKLDPEECNIFCEIIDKEETLII